MPFAGSSLPSSRTRSIASTAGGPEASSPPTPKRRSVAPPRATWTASNAERRLTNAVLSSSPQEHPLERVEEGSRILELGQETLLIPLQEARPELSRETALVVRQQAPPYPLHNCLARLQLVGVDLQADMLPAIAEPVQQRRVRFGGEHRPLPLIAAQCFPKWWFTRDRKRRQMRGVVVVGRHLNGELSNLRQRGGQTPEERLVIGNPLQRGVGEDEIKGCLARERAKVFLLEPETVAREGRALGQHRWRVVDADRLPCR